MADLQHGVGTEFEALLEHFTELLVLVFQVDHSLLKHAALLTQSLQLHETILVSRDLS